MSRKQYAVTPVTDLMGALEEIREFLTALISPNIIYDKIVCAALECKLARKILFPSILTFKKFIKVFKIIFSKNICEYRDRNLKGGFDMVDVHFTNNSSRFAMGSCGLPAMAL